MSSQAADVHLLRRLTQLEKDLDGMCKELHRRRPSPKNSNQELRARASGGHSKELRRKLSPHPQLSRSASRGERRNPSKSPSTPSLHYFDQKLSAVLETPPGERRAGASREDCGSNGGSNAWTGSVPSTKPVGSPPAKVDNRSSMMSRSPSDLQRTLTKSQSTTTAGLGSCSSESCGALRTVVSNEKLAPLRMLSEATSEAATPRSRQQKDLGHSPRTLTDTSACKSVGAPVERIDLGDSDGSRAEAKRDLVWQLELEKLRNATLKLEVQREICESSDLKKRLQETETTPIAPSHTLLVPAVSSVTSVPLVPTASVARLPISQASNLQQQVVNGHALHYSPRHRNSITSVIAPSTYTQRLN